jgi:vacuolar-type H+-ATPase subunit E/Vma4
MASPALFETMTRQVEAECADHLSKARAEAERILADARAKAAASREAVLKSARAEVDRLDTLWRQKAEGEAVRLDLAMKNDTVEAVLAEVQKKLRQTVEGANFGGILDSLLSELMAAAGTSKDIHVLAPMAQVDRVRSWLEKHGHAGVRVEGSAEFWDGVAVQDPKRSYRISNTLTGRFARVEQAARKHCMTSLFGGKA